MSFFEGATDWVGDVMRGGLPEALDWPTDAPGTIAPALPPSPATRPERIAPTPVGFSDPGAGRTVAGIPPVALALGVAGLAALLLVAVNR